MNNKDAIIAFYTLVNRLYSINYSAMRISAQRNPKESAAKFKFDSKSPKQFWIDAKLKDISSLREEFFTNYFAANKQNVEYFSIVDEELENSKNTLMQIHNIFFETEMPFEEIFDGFVCKSPELFEFLKIIDTQPFCTNDPSLVHLADAYTTYIKNLFYHTIVHSMMDNIEQLANDVNTYGVPTLYNGVIQNDTLTTISADKLKEYRAQIEEKHRALEKVKIPKKNKALLSKYNIAIAKYFETDVFLVQLEERLKAANTDIVNTLSNKIVEGTMDLLTGAKTDEKLKIDKVYATKLELSYLEYLAKMFGVTFEQFNAFVAEEEKQKI